MTTASADPAPATSVAGGSRDLLDDAIGRLPLTVRDDLATVGERISWLMRFGRKVRVVPILFVVVWPFLLFGLLRDAMTARRLLRREDVHAGLLAVQWLLFEQAWDEEHDGHLPAGQMRDLVLLRHAASVFGFSILGPPVIIVGFVAALLLAGR